MHHAHGDLDLGWLLAALPPGIAALSLYFASFSAGLLSGVTHCAGMCGPFVLSRAARGGLSMNARSFGLVARLRLGALPAYHLGRAVTYTALGAVAGGFGAGFAEIVGLTWPRYALVAFAGILLIIQATGLSRGAVAASGSWSRGVAMIAGSVARAPGVLGDLALGGALGFLPCGMIYAMLPAAAGSGSAVAGAFCMLSFAIGTWPGLVAIGVLGVSGGRRLRARARWFALPLAALGLVAMGLWVSTAS